MAKLKKLNIEVPELLERLTAQGFPVKSIADLFKVNKRTLERRIANDPNLKAAITKGRLEQKIEIYKTAFEMAVSGKYPTMTKFWLQVQCGWHFDMNGESEKHVSHCICDTLPETTEEIELELRRLEMEYLEKRQFNIPT